MSGTRWKLFRLAGIPVYLDASWLIIVTLLTLSLSGPRMYFPSRGQTEPNFRARS
jgi:hypothetical protein